MNKKVKTLPVVITFRITETDKKTLDRLVTKSDTNYSEFVRQGIQSLINKMSVL